MFSALTWNLVNADDDPFERLNITKMNKVAPNITFQTLEGNNVSLVRYRGKVVMLNFWATWCGPCRVEMPSMSRLQTKVGDTHFKILAVSIGENKSTVQSYVSGKGFSFQVFLDQTRQAWKPYATHGIPTTYIINKRGYIIGQVIGARQWDSEQFVSFFKSLTASN